MTENILIEWNDRYSVNIEEIDKQHKHLIGLINNLYDAFKQGNAKNILRDILDEMLKYTQYHFKTEEKYFKRFSYSKETSHVAEHQQFIEKTNQFIEDFNSGKVSVSFDVMDFLREWLINHIRLSDKHYSKEFARKL